MEALAVSSADISYVTGRRVNAVDQSSFLTVSFDLYGTIRTGWPQEAGLVSYGDASSYDARAGGYAVAVDAAGDCYVTGSSGDPDLPEDDHYKFVTMKYLADGTRRWKSVHYRGDFNFGFDLGRRLVLGPGFASGYLYATGCSWNPTLSRLEYATVLYNRTTGARGLIGYYGDSVYDWALGLAVAPNGSRVAVTGGVPPDPAYPNWATVLYVPPATDGPSR